MLSHADAGWASARYAASAVYHRLVHCGGGQACKAEGVLAMLVWHLLSSKAAAQQVAAQTYQQAQEVALW